jgi:hemerythrin
MSTVVERGQQHHFAIEWRQGFNTGVEQVDDEHKHLFDLVKRLDLASIEKTLDELLEYVVTHFTNEQALMEQCGYPDFQQHLALHEQLATQVTEFLSTGTEWNENRLLQLRKFLNQWLVGHILTHDLRFGRWHAEQKSKPRSAQASAPQRSWLQRLLSRS